MGMSHVYVNQVCQIKAQVRNAIFRSQSQIVKMFSKFFKVGLFAEQIKQFVEGGLVLSRQQTPCFLQSKK